VPGSGVEFKTETERNGDDNTQKSPEAGVSHEIEQLINTIKRAKVGDSGYGESVDRKTKSVKRAKVGESGFGGSEN
jgi:hypothetical protein